MENQENSLKDDAKSLKSNAGMEKDITGSVKLLRLSKTGLLILCFVGMGMASSFLNACIPDLRVRLNTTVEGLSYAFAFGASGALVSTPLAVISDRLGSYSELILGCCLVLSAVSNTMRPLTDNLWIFAISDFLDDIAWGLLANVANSVMLLMWGSSGNPPLHAMHFGFPIGATLGGQIARAFVSTNTTTENSTLTDTWLQSWTIPEGNSQGNITSWMSFFPLVYNNRNNHGSISDEKEEYQEFLDDSQIEIGFLIIAGFNLALGIIFTMLQFTGNRISKVQVGKKSYQWNEIIHPSKWGGDSAKFGLFIFFFFTFFQIALQGCDKGIKQYLTTYAVDSDLGFDNQQAASLSSMYYLLDAVGSMSCIFLARVVSIKIILFAEVHGITLLSILLILFGTQDRTALYILVPLFAMFKGPTWASSYAWPNHYIIMFSTLLGIGKIIRNILDIFMNALQGYLYTNTVIESIFYTTFAYALVMCIMIYITYFVTWNRTGRHGRDEQMKDTSSEQGYVNTNISDIFLKSTDVCQSWEQDLVVTHL